MKENVSVSDHSAVDGVNHQSTMDSEPYMSTDRVIRAYRAFPDVYPVKGSWSKVVDNQKYACPLTVVAMHELGVRPQSLFGPNEHDIQRDFRFPDGYEQGFTEGFDGTAVGEETEEAYGRAYHEGTRDGRKTLLAVQDAFGKIRHEVEPI